MGRSRDTRVSTHRILVIVVVIALLTTGLVDLDHDPLTQDYPSAVLLARGMVVPAVLEHDDHVDHRRSPEAPRQTRLLRRLMHIMAECVQAMAALRRRWHSPVLPGP